MQRIVVAPGLVLTETMYEAAASGLAAHAPYLSPLPWNRFVSPAGWLLVPDRHGDAYKAEHTLLASRERTAKLNLWFLPDLRSNQAPTPHNHPWEAFESHILLGGYTEDRYTSDGAHVQAERGVAHTINDRNVIPGNVYHEVTGLQEPGGTMTLMVCGPGERGSWGYLDLSTGHHRSAEPDLHFTTRLKALNPHR